MLVRNKKTFSMGGVLAITFVGVLLIIFSPVFAGKSGLQYAADSFNKLAKGSSYFIPKVTESAGKMNGKTFEVKVKVDDKEQVENTAKLFATAGAKASVDGSNVSVSGDLGGILASVIADSDAMYHNDGAKVSGRYGYDEKQAMKNWWGALAFIEKDMKKQKLLVEAKAVGEVNKKAVEPGYNFYKIEIHKVSENVGKLSGLLVFYVLYTMWWGYAIFFLFDGIGLSMKKSKVKKEA